jgi:hypothetical protein
MLEVQKFLQDQQNVDVALSRLNDMGIGTKVHENGKLVLLNYNMIDADKSSKIVAECRGTVLEMGTWRLIGKGFDRFFNLHEMPQINKYFNWADFKAYEKVDGTLVNVWRYEGKVYINTRNTFGDGQVNDTQFTWRQLVERCVDLDSLFRLPPHLNVSTFVFEFCSLYNKIVREYPETQLFLLSAFRGEQELTHCEGGLLSQTIKIKRPDSYEFKSQYEVEQFIREIAEKDKTFEGIVLRDNENRRIKVKSAAYLALSRLSNNKNIASHKNLVPLILLGETDEVLAYFSELKSQIDEIVVQLNIELGQLMQTWEKIRHFKDQKEFALAALDGTRFNAILFKARKNGECPSKIWRESADLILKVLYDK